jgi:hypothetical protein
MCDGNVHDEGAVEITSSALCYNHPDFPPQSAADHGTDSEFWWHDKPNQWICFDFNGLMIEPTHYTIQTFRSSRNPDVHV